MLEQDSSNQLDILAIRETPISDFAAELRAILEGKADLSTLFDFVKSRVNIKKGINYRGGDSADISNFTSNDYEILDLQIQVAGALLWQLNDVFTGRVKREGACYFYQSEPNGKVYALDFLRGKIREEGAEKFSEPNIKKFLKSLLGKKQS